MCVCVCVCVCVNHTYIDPHTAPRSQARARERERERLGRDRVCGCGCVRVRLFFSCLVRFDRRNRCSIVDREKNHHITGIIVSLLASLGNPSCMRAIDRLTRGLACSSVFACVVDVCDGFVSCRSVDCGEVNRFSLGSDCLENWQGFCDFLLKEERSRGVLLLFICCCFIKE